MDQYSNEYGKISSTPGDGFFAVIGKAAEEEMLKECELWELKAGDIKIPEKTESRILALAREGPKKQRNKHNISRERLIKRYAKGAAVVVLLLSASFTALLTGATTLRGKLVEFIFQNNSPV